MTFVPFSGAIPSLYVTKSSLTNNLAGGIVNNAITSGVNVAFNPQKSPSFVGGLVTPGLLTTASLGASRFLTDNIVNSKALGPLGPLASDLTNTALFNLSQNVLRGLIGIPGSQNSKWFPGGGNEPQANYAGAGGYSYSSKLGGTDLVFQIRKYSSAAASQASQETQPTAPQPAPPPASLSLENATGVGLTRPQSLLSGVGSFLKGLVTPPGSALPIPLSLQGIQIPGLAPPSIAAPTPSPPSAPSPAGDIWSFICAPSEVSWDTSVSVKRLEVFGNNTPPVVSGSRGMRELSLSNAMVEGFTRGVTVEQKIIDLENLTKLTLDGEGGNVIVPVYNICAGEKKYGGADKGLFVIKDIKVKEELRDLSGNTTRAIVDISFSQVPEYQVTKQRDLASKTAAGATSALSKVSDVVDKNLQKQRTAPAPAPAQSPTR